MIRWQKFQVIIQMKIPLTGNLFQGILQRFADEGANCVVSDLKIDDEAHGVANELRDRHAHVIAVACDVSKADQCQALIDESVETFGGIDILTAATASLATLSNIGPGLAGVGPMENFAFFAGGERLLGVSQINDFYVGIRQWHPHGAGFDRSPPGGTGCQAGRFGGSVSFGYDLAADFFKILNGMAGQGGGSG